MLETTFNEAGAVDDRGRVLIAGAGPGDPDLLTVAALRAMQTADVILHDRLVPEAILSLVPAGRRMHPVGKEGFGKSVPQDEINALMIREAKAGQTVLRLKAGDPGIFGRLDEEVEALDAAGVAWSVIPGITAAAAAAASLGRSLTRRGRNSGLRLLSAHTVDGFAECDWSALAREGEVAVLYMGKRAARFIQGRLLLHGADPALPIAVVENASRPDERIIDTTLARLPGDIAAAGLAGPAVIVVGIARTTIGVTRIAL